MDKSSTIISNLEKLGLSYKEGEVYLELVKNPSSNGSKIAKKLGYPRTSVYDTLRKLSTKGYILALQEGEITSYVPVNPDELILRLKKEMNSASELLTKEFKEIDTTSQEAQFYNLRSEGEIIERINQILESAQKEIYINTNWNLERYKNKFDELKEKGVRILLFSFYKAEYDKLGIEGYYRDGQKEKVSDKNRRILIVCDMEKAIMASNYGGNFNGTYSNNPLLVNILAEHIHNDIYIMKLENRVEGNFWEDISLHTLKENREN